MNKYNFLDLTAFIGIFVVLFLALFLFTVKTKHKLGNQLFAFFLIANAIDASKYLIHHVSESYISIEAFRWSIALLVPALFYLYVKSICFSDFRLKPKHLLHALPFIIFNFVLIPRLYLENTAGKLYFLENLIHMPEIYFFQILFEALFQIYFIGAFLILKKSKTIYFENYTNPNLSLIKALYLITIVYYLLHLIVLFRRLITYTIGFGEIRDWIITIDGFGFLLSTCWYLFIALNNPEFFRGINSKLKLAKDIAQKRKAPTLTDDVKNHQIEHLKEFMATEEPYLDPSLTIQELAKQVKMPVKDLSVLINFYMDKHFFDFVNEYRIVKAMEILKNSLQKELTVLEILHQVGFNSKSSFNTSFKKHTGKTPTDFRNNSF
ncbi:helix-turn-helix domain-containing protein [Flavobacterium psychrophilum]|uniref:helix-turn-helix domain-containing protein n=1 Tax=Flavobacterium psychrophilum TaxID=96345 RepID=UPI000B7C27CD|nr:helix-turn-helix domain-containing protein [Flavobacterium psychrophilum]MBF2025065.1 helix-turn-helix domain-containing protein [Flavobacterium psychrophilum]MCB5984609.1 helix-turn-helix domain-containing protein [Flavobacterium psychrophilum]MCB5995534.1 helix-turn-helix domain-containing protein [Flavobacterium psychrophilum]MCB5997939.1 helix-turn-helix domain-containing protein [Flavobacterium psychrophilum]MCB6005446.1 helix-turn-helix domain-containing protein [Flavobacterium psychr